MDERIESDQMPQEMAARYGRIHRLLEVLTLIKSGMATTPADLAKACRVAERTIYRDLKELEGAGFSIPFNNATGRYEVCPDRFLPPVQLTPDEALAIAVLCGEIARHEQIPFTGAAWAGLSKLLAAMPAPLRDEVSATADAVCIHTARSVPADGFAPLYELIRAGLATRRSLVCCYDSLNAGSDSEEEFDFDPYALFFSVRAWYVVGMHHGRGAVRTLKLNRFTQIQATHRAYSIPEDFTIDTHLGNAWRMMRGDRDHRVALRFDAGFAETISDTVWHPTQEIENLPCGSVIFRCVVSGLDEIVWWVLSMGPHCEVLEPTELRERVREKVSAMAGMYQQQAGAGPA
jgi:predicted DNA-binding transcriptional regulator YafY